MSWELHRVTIVGGGMMGRSLATKVAQEGINVYLKEVSAEAVEKAQRELERSLDHSIERFALTGSEKKAILSRITWVTHFDCASDSDLALEAVQEDFGLKRQILRELDRRMPPEHPIVLTTSTNGTSAMAPARSPGGAMLTVAPTSNPPALPPKITICPFDVYPASISRSRSMMIEKTRPASSTKPKLRKPTVPRWIASSASPADRSPVRPAGGNEAYCRLRWSNPNAWLEAK